MADHPNGRVFGLQWLNPSTVLLLAGIVTSGVATWAVMGKDIRDSEDTVKELRADFNSFAATANMRINALEGDMKVLNDRENRRQSRLRVEPQ